MYPAMRCLAVAVDVDAVCGSTALLYLCKLCIRLAK